MKLAMPPGSISHTVLQALLLGVLGAFAAPAIAVDMGPYEAHGYVDLRAVAVDTSLVSFTQGGLGLLRYDEDHDGVQFGRLAVDFSGPLTESLRAQVTASMTNEEHENLLDVTDAFVEWRPYPSSNWRWRSKLGAFHPPVSLENRGVGWQSIYTLSPSAINTWMGEEVRSVGFEVSATNSGAASQRPFDFGMVAGVYGWNDPCGVLIFERGWAIHDRETTLFGSLPTPFPQNDYDHRIDFTQEIDNRPGYYAGVEAKWQSRYVLRALHYDNRGDPSQSNRSNSAWLTRFDSLGARLELPGNVTLIAQWMGGDTGVGPSDDGRGMLIADYWSWFTLASYATGAHRLSVRYDRMYLDSTRGAQYFDSTQNAHAWTAAYFYEHDEHWQVGIEALRVDGSLAQREYMGIPAAALERQLEIAVRYSF